MPECPHPARLWNALGDAECRGSEPEHFRQQHIDESTVDTVVRVVRVVTGVIVSTALFASCGAAGTDEPTPTTVATTTTSAPAPLTPADVDLAIGTPDDLQARSAAAAGNYQLAPTKELRVTDAAALFIEAQGIVQAYSRRMTMDFINQNNPMSVHRARGIMRVIVFDSATNANEAVRRQGNSFEPIGTPEKGRYSFMSLDDGVRRTGRWHVRVGGDLPCLHEGLSQHGRVVAWMVVRNRNCGGWVESLPAEFANNVAGALVASHPRFAA